MAGLGRDDRCEVQPRASYLVLPPNWWTDTYVFSSTMARIVIQEDLKINAMPLQGPGGPLYRPFTRR